MRIWKFLALGEYTKWDKIELQELRHTFVCVSVIKVQE